MAGDLADIVSRLWAVLPDRWFGEQSPNLEALLRCIATPWVWLYGSINYVIAQTRLLSATDQWLDLISRDYFGSRLGRKINEGDVSYRSRIQRELLRDAGTRAAVSSGIADLTGTVPQIFEPANCMDTGSYAAGDGSSNLPGSGLAYGVTGGWGNLNLPFQFFVSTTRPATAGVAWLAGYGTSNGGYGESAIGYVDISSLPGHVTDQDIQSTVCRLLPVNATAWLRIQ